MSKFCRIIQDSYDNFPILSPVYPYQPGCGFYLVAAVRPLKWTRCQLACFC